MGWREWLERLLSNALTDLPPEEILRQQMAENPEPDEGVATDRPELN